MSAASMIPALTSIVTVTVPAGEYFLGDPCYFVPDEDWMPLLNSCDFFRQPVGEVKGFKVYAFDTLYGDGSYPSNVGRAFGVDAGLIGLVPVSYGSDKYGEGYRLKSDVDFIASRSDQGVLTFGPVVIDTGFNDSDEEE